MLKHTFRDHLPNDGINPRVTGLALAPRTRFTLIVVPLDLATDTIALHLNLKSELKHF